MGSENMFRDTPIDDTLSPSTIMDAVGADDQEGDSVDPCFTGANAKVDLTPPVIQALFHRAITDEDISGFQR